MIRRTRLFRPLKNTRPRMATNRPAAVAINASATPPVTLVGAVSAAPSTLKASKMPTMVPNRPSSGPSVTMVSSIHRLRSMRGACSMMVSSMRSARRTGSFTSGYLSATSSTAPWGYLGAHGQIHQRVAIHVFHLEHGARDQLALTDDLGEIPSAVDDDGESHQQDEDDDVQDAARDRSNMD